MSHDLRCVTVVWLSDRSTSDYMETRRKMSLWGSPRWCSPEVLCEDLSNGSVGKGAPGSPKHPDVFGRPCAEYQTGWVPQARSECGLRKCSISCICGAAGRRHQGEQGLNSAAVLRALTLRLRGTYCHAPVEPQASTWPPLSFTPCAWHAGGVLGAANSRALPPHPHAVS